MDSTPIALYLIFQVFFGLTNWQYSLTMKSEPEDLSELEYKFWRENSLFATVATVALLFARINGIVFLLFFGFTAGWVNAFVIFVAGVICSIVLGVIIRKGMDSLLPALLGYPVMFVTAVLMWFTFQGS